MVEDDQEAGHPEHLDEEEAPRLADQRDDMSCPPPSY